MKKVLYITSHNAKDRTSWSGVLYSLDRELSKYFEMDYLVVPLESPLAFKIRNRLTYIFTKTRQSYINSIWRAKKNSKLIDKFLENKEYDAIFAIDAASLAFVQTKIPIVFYSDAIASKMVNYYWFNLSQKAIYEANYVQKRGLSNSKYCIFTSNWARLGALEDYGIPDEKLKIVHTGANIEKDNIVSKPHDNINLLFCGSDWKRKGGDMAIECLRSLTRLDPSRKYELHMYGCKPPYEIKDDNIFIHGFLNRDIPEQRAIFEDLWASADFFVSPLLADCAAASFCEACAYSVPSVTFDIGGIADHVVNDVNGYRLPAGSSANDFANVIINWINSPGKLEEMKKNARKMYEEDLNWQVAGQKIKEIIESC